MSPPKALFGAPLFSKKQLEQDFFCPYAATGLLISVVSAIVGRGSFEVLLTKQSLPVLRVKMVDSAFHIVKAAVGKVHDQPDRWACRLVNSKYKGAHP